MLFTTISTVALAQAGTLGEIVSPEPGTTLTSSTVTFTWTGQGTWYYLLVGTTGLYSSDIFGGSPTRATSQVVSGIPTTTPVYVTLGTSTAQSGTGNGIVYYPRDFTYNMDRDSDGINDAIDANPDLYDLRVTVSGPDYTLTVLGSGRVASLQISPTLFDDLANGMNSVQMQELTRKVYTHFEDVFDFILFTSDNGDPPGPPYAGANFGVKNDIGGIGIGMYNQAVQFGSAGRLQSAIHLRGGDAQNGPSLHEIMHRWGAYLGAVPTVFPGHWGYSSVGGILGGWKPGSLENLGGGLYRARSPGTGQFDGSFGGFGNGVLAYSELELYIMGLIAPTGLPDIQIANDFQWVDSHAGRFSASSISNVSMNAVVAANGPRIPDYVASQKNFRAMQVIIVKAPLRFGSWARYDESVYRFSLTGSNEQRSNFWEATGGRATLEMGNLKTALKPNPNPSQLLNISTRMRVQTGENVMITGFIVQGSSPKRVLIRAAGPSLTQLGVPNALANPRLELHDSSNTIGMNDNWQTTQIGGIITSDQVAEIQNSGLAPRDPLESAVIATLPRGSYTAIVQGVNSGTGIGIVEVYDLGATSGSLLANISTRGFVEAGDNVMIGGLIIGPAGGRSATVVVRAIGPSLAAFGITGALQNPTLDLVNSDGVVIRSNNDWRESQSGEIIPIGLQPTDDRESAIIVSALAPGNYTAIVRGVGNTTGVGLVEAYNLQ